MNTTTSVAKALTQELGLEDGLAPYRDLYWDGSLASAPQLHLDDFSAIPFLVDISGVEEYQHRARLRAESGDLFATVTPQPEGYEDYCRDALQLGEPEFLRAEPVNGELYLADALAQSAALQKLIGRAREAGGLIIHPYMGIEAVWALARQTHRAAGVPVQVLAPPPPVTWIANDKGVFGRLVELTLGGHWLVESFSEARVSSLAHRLRELATRHERVALKRLRCASAMGNRVLDSSALLSKSDAELEQLVGSFLESTEWQGDEEVLAVAWESAAHSPSTQLWIPPVGSGAPKVDGVYEQILAGKRGIFVGSRPSSLPEPLNRRMAEASLKVARVLQELGYVGRCSFDLLVVGDALGEYELRFTECNGRWGGTSTPMSLLDRLLPRRPPYRAQDLVHKKLVGATLPDILKRVGDDLFRPADRRGRFVFYNTGPLADHGKLDVIALGTTQNEAERALEEDLPRLLNL